MAILGVADTLRNGYRVQQSFAIVYWLKALNSIYKSRGVFFYSVQLRLRCGFEGGYCSNSIFYSPATPNKMNTLLASLLVFTICLSVGEYFTIICQVRVDI